jgi:hypothetical protein
MAFGHFLEQGISKGHYLFLFAVCKGVTAQMLYYEISNLSQLALWNLHLCEKV